MDFLPHLKDKKAAKFAAEAFTAAGLDLEAAMATENVNVLADALAAHASAAERIAELETVAAEVEDLKTSHAAVKEQAEHLHAAITQLGIDADAEDLVAQLEAKASTKAAEIAAAAGIKPLEAHVPSEATDRSNTPADKYAHYKTLTGEARRAYFAEHKAAIWAARSNEIAGDN